MTTLLKVTNLSKSYGNQKVLQNLSFEIQQGEIFVVVGKSGSGKSTLLRLLTGILNPEKGSINLSFNRDNFMGTNEGGYKGIGYVPQTPSLLETKTVRENISLWADLMNFKPWSLKTILKDLGLDQLSEKYPSQLSRGQQQKVALARALVLSPTLLIMDEPFASIDELSKEVLDTMIIDLKQKYRLTVLFVTHSIEEAVYIADKILVLRSEDKNPSIVKIEFNKDRQLDLKLTEKFFTYEKRIKELI